MLWVAVAGPHTRRVVTPFHELGQQCMPRVGAAGMYGTTTCDVGMGGIIKVDWLHWPGRAAVVTQHVQGLQRCPPQR